MGTGKKMPTHLSALARPLFLAAITIAMVAGIVNAWNAEPHLWLTYQLQAPGSKAVKVERCGDDDPREYFYRESPDGRYFNIELCLKTVQKSQLKFIPYAIDADGTSWIELNNSPQVGLYTRSVARSFALPEADQRVVQAQWEKEKWRARFGSLGRLVAGMFAFGLLCWASAWVARRFFGFAPAKRIGQRN
jgi:hypothetical protein